MDGVRRLRSSASRASQSCSSALGLSRRLRVVSLKNATARRGNFTSEVLEALFVYLQSIPAVSNRAPQPLPPG